MIHPATELRLVSASIGYGVFATQPIPRGTITYARDALEIELTCRQFEQLDEAHRVIVDKYSYIDPHGRRVVSWDHAKYVNHSCECNSMSTGYGFEIALRDIDAGEEITDEYGLFNLQEPMAIDCGCSNCRGYLYPSDPEVYAERWDRQVTAALERFAAVEQPLLHLLDHRTRRALDGYLAGTLPYRSVATLRWRPGDPAPDQSSTGPRMKSTVSKPSSPRAASISDQS